MTIHDFAAYRPAKKKVDGSGGGGKNGDMDHEDRIRKLEETIPTLATKQDVRDLAVSIKADMAEIRTEFYKNNGEIKRWMIGTILALFVGFAGMFFAITNSINGQLQSAREKSVPQAAQPPIIINVPAQAAPPPAAPTK